MYENIRVVTSITVLSFLLWKVIGVYNNSNYMIGLYHDVEMTRFIILSDLFHLTELI